MSLTWQLNILLWGEPKYNVETAELTIIITANVSDSNSVILFVIENTALNSQVATKFYKSTESSYTYACSSHTICT